MFPKYHFLLGFVFSLILFIFCPKIDFLAAIIIFLSSFLIDIDHYLFLILNKGPKNIFKAYFLGIKMKKKGYQTTKEKRKKIKTGFYIFHGIEFLVILVILGYLVHDIFYFILIGCFFHLVLDAIETFAKGYRKLKFSSIYDCFLFKKSNKTLKNNLS